MKIQSAIVGAFAVGVAACAPEPTLEPAPGAQPAPRDGSSAMAEVAGVRMTAWSERWDADPRNLTTEVTPVLVELRNDGDRPVRVRFNEFELVNPAGENFQAIPPFQIDAEVTEPVRALAYPYRGFRVAPYLSRYYPFMSPFDDPWLHDGAYYDPWVTFWRERDLPTGEMVQLALPEGVLEPGGTVSGFVYFEDVTDDAEEVTLTFDLVTPDDTRIGEIELPFRVTD